MKGFSWLRFILFAGIIVFLCFPGTHVHAQVGGVWSRPEQIPNYDPLSFPPLMVADSSGVVHALNVEAISANRKAIFYRTWQPDQGWSTPIDIILLSINATYGVLQDLYLDAEGMLHLVFYSEEVMGSYIYYTHAPVAEAGRVRAWSKPVVAGEDASTVTSARLAFHPDGRISLLYTGRDQGLGLYESISDDGGETWSAPMAISLELADSRWPTNIMPVFDENGVLHVVWAIVNERGVGDEIYYARYNESEAAWSTPYLIATRSDDEYSTNWPSIASYGNQLIIVYQDSFPATKWMRISNDGGMTWAAPSRPFLHIGEYETPVMVKDSAGVLHLILGNRIGDPAVHGMWHTTWQGSFWGDLTPITSGPQSEIFDPSGPSVVVMRGNTMLVAWWNNTGNRNGVWYSYTTLDAPQLPAEPVPTPFPSPTPMVREVQVNLVATAKPTLDPQLSGGEEPPAGVFGNPLSIVLAGVAPASLLAITLLVIKKVFRSGR